MVYFIQQGTDGPIKIGKADRPFQRLVELQTAHADELRLLGVLRGGLDLEAELQARFADGHIRGEWFRADTAGLLGYIDANATKHPELNTVAALCAICRSRPIGARRKRYCDVCGDPRKGEVRDEAAEMEMLAAALRQMAEGEAAAA